MSAQKGTASTRLLGMKFMQRAAASETNKSAPNTPDGPPAKRVRLSKGFSSPHTPGLSDQQRLQAAQAEEHLQRSAVIARLAAEAGETHWVLNVKEPAVQKTTLNIVHTGFADLDGADDEESGNEEEDEEGASTKFVAGRMIFGQLKKYQAPEVKQEPSTESDSSDGDSDSEDSDHDEDSYKGVREARAIKKEDKKSQEQQRLAALRRQKEINLNKDTRRPPGNDDNMSRIRSISGGKPRTGRGGGTSYRPH